MSYPQGDTYEEAFTESGVPFQEFQAGELSSEQAVFATGAIRVQPDGTVTTRYSCPGGLDYDDPTVDGGTP